MIKILLNNLFQASDALIDCNNYLNVIIGPQKTATTSLSKFLISIGAADKRKEFYFTRITWINRRIISRAEKRNQMLLLPYLLHDKAELKRVLRILKLANKKINIIITERSDADWAYSLNRHNYKYSKPRFTSKGIYTDIIDSIDFLNIGFNGHVRTLNLFEVENLTVLSGDNAHVFRLKDWKENATVARRSYSKMEWLLVAIYIRVKVMIPETFYK